MWGEKLAEESDQQGLKRIAPCLRTGLFVVFANQGATNFFIALEAKIVFVIVIVVIVVKVVFGGVERVAVGSAA